MTTEYLMTCLLLVQNAVVQNDGPGQGKQNGLEMDSAVCLAQQHDI